jgi:crotonobetainyl-CoA:carnitine CoA-transferase CaiB-like acyl-CoA transferase
MSLPLAGIRILEVGHMLAGPYCAMLLADLGAEVVKIETPGAGDIARGIGGHTVGPHGAYFASLNRGKRSVTLDLACADGQRQLGRLAAGSHALITNLRPAAIRKLGLTYAALARHNPKLVCVALTGYGLDGPYAERPAYDYVIQGLTGVMSMTGEPGAPPTKAGYSAVDNSAGIMAAMGLLAKIVQGQGGQVDVAMFDVMLSQLNYLASAWLNGGEPTRRHAHSAHPYIVPAQIFAAADDWIVLFITHDEFWQRFCNAVGRAGWISDPRYAGAGARREHREALLAEIGALIATRSAAHWVELLAPLGIVVSGIATLEQALDSELARSRRMLLEIPTAGGPLRLVGNPVQVGPPAVPAPPPLLGEHNSLYLE